MLRKNAPCETPKLCSARESLSKALRAIKRARSREAFVASCSRSSDDGTARIICALGLSAIAWLSFLGYLPSKPATVNELLILEAFCAPLLAWGIRDLRYNFAGETSFADRALRCELIAAKLSAEIKAAECQRELKQATPTRTENTKRRARL